MKQKNLLVQFDTYRHLEKYSVNFRVVPLDISEPLLHISLIKSKGNHYLK